LIIINGDFDVKVINVVGARPNFMKIAPIIRELKKYSEFEPVLLHTGQHYDVGMSNIFFQELNIPEPDIYLGVGSNTHAQQTAEIMKKFEEVCIDEKPDLVLVVGDVNSTLACALVAVKLQIKIAHVEAGLRSFNWEMPEEINRVLTDRIADYLFTTSKDANENLKKEGIPESKMHFVGNVMIDTLKHFKSISEEKSGILHELKLDRGGYAVLTMHRAENVDHPKRLKNILDGLEEVQNHISIVYPIHPRSLKMIQTLGFTEKIQEMSNLNLIDPRGYLDFLNLVINSKFVLTDSGGLQEETTVLGIPCITMRGETERPVTVTEGTNVIVGTNKDKIIEESLKVINGRSKKGKVPEFWDGKAAERIVEVIRKDLT
jgi:UDP-N-acetylglucosamine 2-epimerase (non-hydrolysing)